MKRGWFVLAAVALAAGLSGMPGHAGEDKGDKKDRKSDERVSALMKRKLHEAQRVLEGVATSDCDLIAAHGRELIVISNEAEWKVIKTPEYERHSNAFRRTAETLVQNARDNNVDAAALSYVELTLTCVRCHKYVREVRMVRADPGEGG
jgi:hypothetical protein